MNIYIYVCVCVCVTGSAKTRNLVKKIEYLQKHILL